MDKFLFAAAAVVTIAGFLLELWREFRPKQKNGKGRKKKNQR